MHDTHSSDELAAALLDIVGFLNGSRQDGVLMAEAGLAIDRALLPLLVRIGTAGSIGVVDLADQVGRDHSTISRQVAKLGQLGLVDRRRGADDGRVREATITEAGRTAVEAVTAARRRLLQRLLADWTDVDRKTLARLNRRFADALLRVRM